MSITTILLDDGGVMSDNWRRVFQWQQWLGLYLSERLGATPDAWAAANRAIIPDLLDPKVHRQWADPMLAYADFEQWYAHAWFEQMADHLQFTLPADLDRFALYQQASAFVTARVDAAFVGVPATIRILHEAGYRLYTASNESSADLHGYLGVMGIRDVFGRLYGPDLVGTLKNSPLYYQRIASDTAIDPHSALVVDDNPKALGWAREVGFQTLLVAQIHADNPTITRLTELPTWLNLQPSAFSLKPTNA